MSARPQDMNLIPNAADRYSVGDRTPGLRWDHYGGLTMRLQPEPPGGDGQPNWLPTSAADPWFAILRMYRPHPEVIAASWECPGITKAGRPGGGATRLIQLIRTEGCGLSGSAHDRRTR